MPTVRRIALVLLTAAAGAVAGSAAQATTSWGGLRDYYGGNLVASGSGYYAESSTAELQASTYQDRRSDGHSAYVRANFQPFWHQCYPDPATCRWEWGDVTVKKTPGISPDRGVVSTTLYP